MTRYRRNDSSSPDYTNLLGGSYKPGEFYKVGNVSLDPVDLLGGVTAEKAKELYNLGSSKPGLYAPTPSDFGTDPVTRATKPKYRVQNAIHIGYL